MTPDQFLVLQEQLWIAYGPLAPWLIIALIVGGLWTVVIVFVLTIVNEIAEF